MNWTQVESVVKTVVTVVLTYAVAKGWISSESVEPIIVAILAIAAAGWGVFSNRATGLISKTAALPEVAAIKTTNVSMAQSIPNSIVTPATPAELQKAGVQNADEKK